MVNNMHFSNLVKSAELNPHKELLKIEQYLYHDTWVNETTLKDYINRSFPFFSINVRGSAVDLNNLMDEIGLTQSLLKGTTWENFWLYAELLCNVLHELRICRKNERDNRFVDKQTNAIMGNIQYVANVQGFSIKQDQNGIYFIFSQDEVVDQVAKNIENKDVAWNLIKYKHSSLKGNLIAKKQILTLLYPLLEQSKDQVNGKAPYITIHNDASFLLNQCNIRHTPTAQSIKDATDVELEEWYDIAYETTIFALYGVQHSRHADKIKALKSELKGVCDK